MKKNFIEKLVQNRFQSKAKIRRILDEAKSSSAQKPLPRYITGTRNGVFYRIKVPPPKSILPDIPKLPSSRPAPKSFKQVKAEPEVKNEQVSDVIAQLSLWLKKNWSVLLFNCGSVCTLIGYTRSDVLELRMFAIAGTLSGLIYSIVEIRKFPPMVWGCLFAGINGYKIFEILRERNASVHLSASQEEVYVKHFLPHGVTPKQFEAIDQAATTMKFREGEIIVKQGEKHRYVYLVVTGSTKASALGRYMTAASVKPEHHEKEGGASGAWIGEMAMLEFLWRKQGGGKDEDSAEQSEQLDSDDRKLPKPAPLKSDRNMFTIIAKEDCTLLRWTFDEMEHLMERSTDMRSALTRAMASAIVGKVINFTVSRSRRHPWSAWLGDWNNTDGARVFVDESDSSADEDASPTEQLPSPVIKKFA
jgi:CRP-like cAMP-binding protein